MNAFPHEMDLVCQYTCVYYVSNLDLHIIKSNVWLYIFNDMSYKYAQSHFNTQNAYTKPMVASFVRLCSCQLSNIRFVKLCISWDNAVITWNLHRTHFLNTFNNGDTFCFFAFFLFLFHKIQDGARQRFTEWYSCKRVR